MSVEDFRINAFVRQVLSKSWIDVDALRDGAIGQIVYFHGRFEKVRAPDRDTTGRPDDGRPENAAENLILLERVEKEIRRESSVTDMVFHLDNFRKTNGKWEIAAR